MSEGQLFPVPPRPEPYTVEVELTNHCNARCTFCPHSRMTREKGFMDGERFSRFLEELDAFRSTMWMNAMSGSSRFPRITFAGLGDPTLHPRLPEIVRTCTERGFETQLVTNGYKLSARLAAELVAARLGSCAISLHSLNPVVYKALMGLDLDRTLAHIEAALPVFRDSATAVELWRVCPPPGQPRDTATDEETFRAFRKRFPFATVLGPSEAWERDGQVPLSVWPVVRDSAQVWCHKLYFTLNVAWDGTAVMCRVDFHRITQPLGNVFTDGLGAVQALREEAVRSPPPICALCRRWPDSEYQGRVLPQLVLLHARPEG